MTKFNNNMMHDMHVLLHFEVFKERARKQYFEVYLYDYKALWLVDYDNRRQ